jgi:hypothetical protein
LGNLKSKAMTLAGNPILTTAQQQYNLQVRRFLTAVYALSGKQINESEWAGLIQQYGYTPGDTAETLAAKAAAREVLASSLAIPAGRAGMDSSPPPPHRRSTDQQPPAKQRADPSRFFTP